MVVVIANKFQSSSSGSGSSSSSSGSDSEDGGDDNDEDKELAAPILDATETNLIALRRTIYLTIQVGILTDHLQGCHGAYGLKIDYTSKGRIGIMRSF